MSAIQMRVCPALLLRGSLNAVMPLDIASTPVSDVVPLAKARKMMKSFSGSLMGRRLGKMMPGM